MRSWPRVLLLAETVTAHGRDVVRGIAQYAQAHGPWKFLLEPPPKPDFLPRLLAWRGDGIIGHRFYPEWDDELGRLKVPLVSVCSTLTDLKVPTVVTDNTGAGRLAAEHFIERGFKHLAYMGMGDMPFSQQREAGFRAAAQKAGLPVQTYRPLPPANHGLHSARQAAHLAKWLTKLPRPVGVMACLDTRAREVLDACALAELRVPDEVAVVGVDNDELACALSYPPLSSVDMAAQRTGFEAAALLHRLMKGEPPPTRPLIIEPRGVIVRRSSDALAFDDELLAQAVHYIRQHAAQDISVGDVVRHVPLSRRALELRFHRWLGCSPFELVRRVQLDKVRQLLAETDLGMEQIAAASGLSDAKKLGAVFKRATGRAPSDYRRQFRPAG